MNCQRARELIPWLAAGGLTAEELAELSWHLAHCEACREELAQALELRERVVQAVGKLPPVPKTAWLKVLARLGGLPVGRLELRSFLVGLSLGLSLGRLPVFAQLEILGRKLPLWGEKEVWQ